MRMRLRRAWVAWLVAAAAVTAAAAPASDDYLYVLRAGDNPWNLSERLLVDMSWWPRLVAYNHIVDDRRLPPGTTLRIPAAWLKLRSTTVQLAAVSGDVQVDSGQGRSWQRAESGKPLPTGARLKTGDQSSAALTLADGSRILMLADSELRLADSGETGFGALMIRIELLRGRMENAVHPMRATGGRFEILTPSAVTAVRGTRFRVVAEAAKTRSEVLDGSVQLGNRQGAVTLASGTGSVAARDAAPQPPRPLLPAPDLVHAATGLDAQGALLRWPALTSARSYRIQLLAIDAQGQTDGTLRLDRTTAQPQLHLPIRQEGQSAGLPQGRYLVRARGIDDAGLEGLPAESALTLEAPVQPAEPPIPLSPRAALPVTRAEAALRWRPADAAAGVVRSADRTAAANPAGSPDAPAPAYLLQITPDGRGFATPLIELLGRDRACALPDLPLGRYLWRIAALAGTQPGPWSAPQTFDLVAAAPEITDVVLADRLRLRWSAADPGPAPVVRLQIARDAEFTQIVLDEPRHGHLADLPRPTAGRYHLRVGSLPVEGRATRWGQAWQIATAGLHAGPHGSAVVQVPTLDPEALPPTAAGSTTTRRTAAGSPSAAAAVPTSGPEAAPDAVPACATVKAPTRPATAP